MAIRIPFASARHEQGFSLVELMVVVGIIGILATLAVPRFRSFQAKARQSEAKTNLAQIYTLEHSYYADNNTYAAVPAIGAGVGCAANNAIGFNLDPCNKARYQYTVGGVSATTFTGTATDVGRVVFPGCAQSDTWQINEGNVLQVLIDATTRC